MSSVTSLLLLETGFTILHDHLEHKHARGKTVIKIQEDADRSD